MIYKLKNEIKENKKYIYLSYLISILTMFPQYLFSPPLSSYSPHIIFVFLSLIILFFIAKFSKLLFLIFIIYINLSNIIIGHIFFHWGYNNVDIQPRIDVALISPVYESYEYLKAYFDYRDILLVVYTIFVLFLTYIFIRHFKHSFKILKFLAFVLSTAIIIAAVFYRNPLMDIEPFSIPYKCVKSTTYSKLFKERSKYLRTHQIPIQITKNQSIYDKVVIIQGESANKHHMSIYGYDKNTTPYLSNLKTKGKLYIFNTIAPSNQTKYSIPIFYTKASVHNYKNAFLHSLSILSDFKISGYKTFWISNQGETGSTDTSVSSIAKEADITHFKNTYTYQAKPDEKILRYLDKITDNTNKEMYVFHLMGSHSYYKDRYTKNVNLFKNPKNLLEEYDNTIYYTDYIIKGIANKFKDHKVLIIYVSDHGEVVSENKGQRNGHGYFPPYKDEYDIPFVIYSSVSNDRIEELYNNNKKGYFNLENLNYMIEYMSGIRNDSNISYSSDVFSLKPKNIFDYDKLKFYKD